MVPCLQARHGVAGWAGLPAPRKDEEQGEALQGRWKVVKRAWVMVEAGGRLVPVGACREALALARNRRSRASG